MSDVPHHNRAHRDLSRTSDPLRDRYMEKMQESTERTPASKYGTYLETSRPLPQKSSLERRPDEDANQYLRRMMRQQEEKNVPVVTERSQGSDTSSKTEASEIDLLTDIPPVSAQKAPARDHQFRRRRRQGNRSEGKTSEATTKAQVLADLDKRDKREAARRSKPQESVKPPNPRTIQSRSADRTEIIQNLRADRAKIIQNLRENQAVRSSIPSDVPPVPQKLPDTPSLSDNRLADANAYSISSIDKDVISFAQRVGMTEHAKIMRDAAMERQWNMGHTEEISEEYAMEWPGQWNMEHAEEWLWNMQYAETIRDTMER